MESSVGNAHENFGCHDANSNSGGVGNSIVNTAFFYLYHIAWRLHGFLDKKNASSSSYFFGKAMDSGTKWRQFGSHISASYAPVFKEEDEEDFGIDSDEAIRTATATTSTTITVRESSPPLDENQGGNGAGVGHGEGDNWHDMEAVLTWHLV